MRSTMEFFIPVGLIYHLSLSTASAAPGCCQHNSTLILHNGFQCEFTILNVFMGDRGKQIIAYKYHSNTRSVKKEKDDRQDLYHVMKKMFYFILLH